ncbi:MAG: AlpA family phage regulatory protein [Candidatus Accumulibacter sp.]|jgi:prophage regulatory protein|nr:AlpA family phage regulatory protein [Accumulibacter sp.]
MSNASGAAAPGRTGPIKYRERFLSRGDVSQMVDLSKSTIYRLVAEKSFPSPVSTGAKRVAWLESEVMQWMDARIEERDKKGSLNA